MKQVIYVDIDGVLARHNLDALMKMFNQQWQLGIAQERLDTIETESEFHALPEVQAYATRVGDKEYDLRRKWTRFDPIYVYDKLVISGAREGVDALASNADELAYCTARVITIHERWNAHLASVTQLWLEKQGFTAGEVLFCDGMAAKWEQIARRIKQGPCHLFLIDDRVDLLLPALEQLPGADQALICEHCTLVAFGYDDEAGKPATPLPVLLLPDWQGVNRLIEKEFKNDQRKRPL